MQGNDAIYLLYFDINLDHLQTKVGYMNKLIFCFSVFREILQTGCLQ